MVTLVWNDRQVGTVIAVPTSKSLDVWRRIGIAPDEARCRRDQEFHRSNFVRYIVEFDDRGRRLP